MKFLRLTIKFLILLFLISYHSNLEAGSWQNGQAIGGFNQVDVYTPTSMSPVGNGRALLLVLHGCVQPINNFQTANLEQAAEQTGMVIAVPGAKNKAGFSCWSYWQGSISRTAGDYKNLLDLVNTLLGDSNYNIDADQVYIAGLSSGAAFAMQTACLAPDIFAGVAPSAGPSIGTSSGGAINNCEVVSAATFKQRCESYAGSARSFFDTQLAVIGHGTADSTVDLCYNQQNANGFASVYNASQQPGSSTISDAPGKSAEQHLWQNNRIAMLWLNGLGHEWSGGEGASGSYIGNASINFATYLGNFFAENNLRVNRNTAPSIDTLTVAVNQNRLTIQGTATDVEGSVEQVHLKIELLSSDSPQLIQQIIVQPVESQFTVDSQILADGLYQISAYATDNELLAGEIKSVTQRIGPELPATAPQLSDTSVDVNSQCATVSGTVFDLNLNLDQVIVDFSNASINAQLSDNQYKAEGCNLAGGTNTATITATDTTNLATTDSITFDIDAGITGDYNLHIALGHITWGQGYAECYLAFGTSQFTMREKDVENNQCQWVADDALQCQGPQQTCQSTTPPTDPPSVNCEEFTTLNYSHKIAGRAYSTGSFFAPDYFAQGSNESMPGSTYGSTTLHSEDGGVNWHVGSCS